MTTDLLVAQPSELRTALRRQCGRQQEQCRLLQLLHLLLQAQIQLQPQPVPAVSRC